ncbi:MAG: hypothetical protein HC821_02625 [Lewinella sp.]|nr:hypothetical protein [Lewinella sp.]
MTEIDGVPITRLLEAYGSPLFVFSEREIVSRYRELRDAIHLRVPNARLAWSYKTNYLDAICRLFHREGALAEVVSEFELDKALRNGVAPELIHFNGPYKRARPAQAIAAGVALALPRTSSGRPRRQVARMLRTLQDDALARFVGRQFDGAVEQRLVRDDLAALDPAGGGDDASRSSDAGALLGAGFSGATY